MRILTVFSLVLALLAISAASYLYLNRPKIAFVYNMKILEEYRGTKEGHKVYESKVDALRANLDTLGSEIKRSIAQYENDKKKMTAKESKMAEEIIARKQNDYYNYKNAIEQRMKEEDKNISSALLKQIDTYVLDYAKEKGYDFILGSSDAGSLFFAADKYDITKEVLDGLNKNYDGGFNEANEKK